MRFPLSFHVGATTYVIEGWPFACSGALAVSSSVLLAILLRRAWGPRRAALVGGGAIVAAPVLATQAITHEAHASVPFLLAERSVDWVARVFFVPLLLAHTSTLLAILGVAVAIFL